MSAAQPIALLADAQTLHVPYQGSSTHLVKVQKLGHEIGIAQCFLCFFPVSWALQNCHDTTEGDINKRWRLGVRLHTTHYVHVQLSARFCCRGSEMCMCKSQQHVAGTAEALCAYCEPSPAAAMLCWQCQSALWRCAQTFSSLISFFVSTFRAASASCKAGRAFSNSAATWAAMTLASSVSFAILVASACTYAHTKQQG